MKKVELYKCELCNTSYKSEDMANKCEQSHKIAKSIVDAKYRSFASNDKGYPDKITICFNDGKKIIYEKGRELS